MEIIKQTDTQLVFKVKGSKEALYFYWGVLIAVNIFFVVIFVLIYGLTAAIWVLLILFVFDLIFLEGTIRTYTVAIDKTKETLEIRENGRVIYASDYPLQEIQCVKTVVRPHYWSRIISSLVIVLRNNEEEIIDTAQQGRYRHPPFYIDIQANRQAIMGEKMAEFLGVPYQDSEYTS